MRPNALTRGLAVVIAVTNLLHAEHAEAAEQEALRIAVAANFKATLDRLVTGFTADRDIDVVVSTGASGLLYGQIVQGAPFDLFFSADASRPLRLEREGLVVAGSRFTYAEGVLALWRPGKIIEGTIDQVLATAGGDVLAIANPATAPYGAAAVQVLENLGLLRDPPFRIVRGESIGQTFQFVASGNAALGFIALSQLTEFDAQNGRTSHREALIVDPRLYEPIVQQAVWMAQARDNPLAPAFLGFVRSPAGREIIGADGYRLPPSQSTGTRP